MLSFDVNRFVKYILEGLAVALVTVVIPKKSLKVKEVAMIALTAAATFAVLDVFSPAIASGARTGTGFGVGFSMVGGKKAAAEQPSVEEPVGCGCSAETKPMLKLAEDSMNGVTGMDTEAGCPIGDNMDPGCSAMSA